MTNGTPHITVCVCTYKRPVLLDGLLNALEGQTTGGAFTYSVVIVDNDSAQSAKPLVGSRAAWSVIRIEYFCQPQKNIALTRNEAVDRATGDFVAFVDDDEVPPSGWLFHLFSAASQYNADAVLGPVDPQFTSEPPSWIVRGRLLERPHYPTGTVLRWPDTRTGNVLFRRSVFTKHGDRFSPDFRHSEDQEFFKRITARGAHVIWCDEAAVTEVQGADRFRVAYFLKRALLRGNVSLRLRSYELRSILKSLTAFAAYSAFLPFLALVRRDLFIAYLIKDCDHIGKLLAACRIDIQEYLA
jgi:succinoglycan biosynthesis protein ExoM